MSSSALWVGAHKRSRWKGGDGAERREISVRLSVIVRHRQREPLGGNIIELRPHHHQLVATDRFAVSTNMQPIARAIHLTKHYAFGGHVSNTERCGIGRSCHHLLMHGRDVCGWSGGHDKSGQKSTKTAKTRWGHS